VATGGVYAVLGYLEQ